MSGYTVAPSAFSMEGVDVYKANVCDFMAHAWVEIYLDNIGWVPIEVTPGGSLDSLPTGEEMERWENTSTAHRQDMADQEEPPKIQETETDSEGETESEDSESEERNSEANSESEGQQRPQNRPNGVGAGKSSGSWLKVLKGLCILAVLAVVGFFAVRFIRGSILFYNRVLELDMKKNKTRKAVKRMNRRLYYLLRFSRVNTWFGKRWTDAEYKKALAERFTDVEEESWDRYMDIVKKNHYSHEVITTEEMQYCYECYKKAKVFHEKVF